MSSLLLLLLARFFRNGKKPFALMKGKSTKNKRFILKHNAVISEASGALLSHSVMAFAGHECHGASVVLIVETKARKMPSRLLGVAYMHIQKISSLVHL